MVFIVPLITAGLLTALAATAWLAPHVLYVVPEGEQHVVQRFGRFRTVRKPGLRLRLPRLERIARLPARPFPVPVTVSAVTADGRSVVVEGALELVIEDGRRYVHAYRVVRATGPTIAAGAVSDVVSQRRESQLDDRTGVATAVAVLIDSQLDRYGLHVAAVVITLVRRDPTDRAPRLIAA